MSKNSDHVKRWRRTTKRRMIEAMGGKCVCCGYATCDEALDFHHLDPSTKDFSLGGIRSNPKAWKKICEELRKCCCVCSNCHREIESGNRLVPENCAKFDESFATLKDFRDPRNRFCIECGKSLETFNKSRRYCSLDCRNIISDKKIKVRRKVTWPSPEQLAEDIKNLNWLAIGRKYEVSDNAVRKWAKKYKLI